MSCNCKQDIEAKLKERFASMAPEATGHEVTLQGYAITFGKGLSMRPFMPAKTEATFPLKKGGAKVKTSTVNMFFSHCGFCGEKLEVTA